MQKRARNDQVIVRLLHFALKNVELPNLETRRHYFRYATNLEVAGDDVTSWRDLLGQPP
jgi:hypothetical protein